MTGVLETSVPPEDEWAGGTDAPAEVGADDAHRQHVIRLIVDVVVVAACVVFVLWQLQPELLLRNSTPAGGDMGAHVWGPAYLRDHLLPHGQVAGWTKDWYAGFPAYQFYMVVPSLLIVLLNVGVHGCWALSRRRPPSGSAGWPWPAAHDRRVRCAGGIAGLGRGAGAGRGCPTAWRSSSSR